VSSAAYTRATVSSRGSSAPRLDDELWDEALPQEAARGAGGGAARPPPPPRARSRPHAKLAAKLLVFVICLALLAVVRISLSFAVVQKSLATTRVVNEQRSLAAENSRLTEEAATLSSTLRVRNLAVDELHLAPSGTVLYLHAHDGAGRHNRSR
jgi:cell division protein FtsL